MLMHIQIKSKSLSRIELKVETKTHLKRRKPKNPLTKREENDDLAFVVQIYLH
jgi:hypothetical protein